MRQISIIGALTALVLAMGCGDAGTHAPMTGIIGPTSGGNPGTSGGTGGGTGANGSAVNVGNNFYSPSTTTVRAGTTVTWTWDAGDVIHTVTFDGDTTIMSPFQSSGTFSRTFTSAGTYGYHCSIHGFAMVGSVIVQ